MSGPDRIWAWAWETNPQMGHWTTVQHIVGDGVEYVRIDEVNAIIAAADRRTEMHECAMEERDDCIEDWSKANDQICRLTAELDAMRAALKPITAQDAARVPEIAALIEARRHHVETVKTYNAKLKSVEIRRLNNDWSQDVATEFFEMSEAHRDFIAAAQAAADAALRAITEGK